MKPLKQPQPGDLFYIPAWNREGTYGFVIARHIELIPPNIGYLIEVFAKFYTEPPKSIEEVDTEVRLFRPVMWSMYFFKPWPRWKTLFSDPNYDRAQSKYETIGFAFENCRVWFGGQSTKVSQDVFDGFEPSTCWRAHHLIFRVIAHLSGIFGPNDKYDYHKLSADLRVDNPQMQDAVLDLALEMDRKFQVWQAERKSKAQAKKA